MNEEGGGTPKRERPRGEGAFEEPDGAEFTEEELEQFFLEAEEEERRPSFFEKKGRKKWLAVLLSLALLANVIAFIPQFFSLAAIEFLKVSAQLSQSETIRQYKQAVVVIRSDGRKGTGFLASSEGLVVTNRHVVGNSARSTVYFPDGERYEGDVVAEDPDADIAILDIGRTDRAPLRLSERGEAVNGESVYVIGNPLMFNGIANRGEVWGTLSDREPALLAIQAPIYKGNSGSPVIDSGGEVIGVVFATSHAERGGERRQVGLAVPIELVRTHLTEEK